jgi:ATP-dependent exoDNAse (exonuclease V) beta subunit
LEQASQINRDSSSDKATTTPQLLQRRITSSLKGTKIHRCLEALHYGGSQSYNDLAKELLGDSSSDASRALNFILSVDQPPLERLIKEGSVEWGFHFRHKGFVIEGQVDLWGYDKGEIWVVDYKTGSSFQIEKAFDQLTIYGYALGLKHKNTKINLCVVYPFEEKVVSQVYRDSRAKEIFDKISVGD